MRIHASAQLKEMMCVRVNVSVTLTRRLFQEDEERKTILFDPADGQMKKKKDRLGTRRLSHVAIWTGLISIMNDKCAVVTSSTRDFKDRSAWMNERTNDEKSKGAYGSRERFHQRCPLNHDRCAFNFIAVLLVASHTISSLLEQIWSAIDCSGERACRCLWALLDF